MMNQFVLEDCYEGVVAPLLAHCFRQIQCQHPEMTAREAEAMLIVAGPQILHKIADAWETNFAEDWPDLICTVAVEAVDAKYL